MTTNNQPWRGIPLRERTEEHVRAALSAYEPDTVQAWVDLHAYARHEGIGLSALAAQCNIGSSLLSQGFNGNYEGDMSAIAERIRAFFWRLEQKALYGGIREFRETALATAMWRVLEKTRIIRRIQIVEGPEQVGKSTAAREYTTRNNHGRTVMTEIAGGSKGGLGTFIWNLADQLEIASTIKLTEKRLRIRHALEACDLVIIDEAHLWRSWTVAAARDWWDYLRTDIYANGARGVVLMATNQDMLGELEHWRRDARYNIGQLIGRMRIEPLRIDPVEDILADDVAMLAARYYKPGKATIARLHAAAVQPQRGHLGLVVDVLNEAWSTSKARKVEMSDEVVGETLNGILNVMKQRKELYR